MKGEIQMSTNMIINPKIVSREEWLAARKELLAKEKRVTRERDALAIGTVAPYFAQRNCGYGRPNRIPEPWHLHRAHNR